MKMGNAGSSDVDHEDVLAQLSGDISSANEAIDDAKEIKEAFSKRRDEAALAPATVNGTAPPMPSSLDKELPEPAPDPVLPMRVPESRLRLARTKSSVGSLQKPTAIVKSARAGEEATVKKFISMGMNTHQQDKDGYTALHAACGNGNVAIVKVLIDAEAPLNLQAMNGSTALICALRSQTVYMEIVNLLLESNADCKIATVEGETPLHLAVKANSTELVKKLISRGAIIEVDHVITLNTPLHICAIFGNAEIAKMLVENGADINKQNAQGKTPLILAVENQQDTAVLEYLLSIDAEVKYVDLEEKSAIHYAVMQGKVNAVKVLLRCKDCANIEDGIGRTPLHHAANYPNDPQIFNMLIESKSYVNAKDKKGRTPLHLAAKYANMKEARILLEAGADPSAEDNSNNTPCGLVGKKSSPLFILIQEHGGELSDEEKMRAHRREVTMKRLQTGAKIGGTALRCIAMGC